MNIFILCNSLLALPTLQELIKKGLVSKVGIPSIEHDATDRIRFLCEQAHQQYAVFNKTDLNTSLHSWLGENNPDVVFVLTFPYKISSELLSIPTFGFFNFHFGLLPQYRGPDPIFWQIKNREPFGAVTIHKMDEGLDTGPTILTDPVPINPDDTYGMHFAKLAFAAVGTTQKLIEMLNSEKQAIQFTPQDESKAIYRPKPTFEDLLIDWDNQVSDSIIALVKATNPWNKGAFTFLRGMPIRIVDVSVAEEIETSESSPGTIIYKESMKNYFVQCSDNKILRLDILHTYEGFFLGSKLSSFGIQQGECFETRSLNSVM